MRHAILLGCICLGLTAFAGCGEDEPSPSGGGGTTSTPMTPVTPVEQGDPGPSSTLICEETGQTLIIQPSKRHCFDPRTINIPPAPVAVGGAGGGGGAGGASATPEEPELPPFTGECPVSADVAGACFQPLCDSTPATTQDNPDMPCCYVGDLIECTAE